MRVKRRRKLKNDKSNWRHKQRSWRDEKGCCRGEKKYEVRVRIRVRGPEIWVSTQIRWRGDVTKSCYFTSSQLLDVLWNEVRHDRARGMRIRRQFHGDKHRCSFSSERRSLPLTLLTLQRCISFTEVSGHSYIIAVKSDSNDYESSRQGGQNLGVEIQMERMDGWQSPTSEEKS